MHRICASVLALALFAGDALAADNGALPAGKPAGVAQAQRDLSTFWVVTAGTILVGAGAFLISTQHSTTATLIFGSSDNGLVVNNSVNTSTSTTTSTN